MTKLSPTSVSLPTPTIGVILAQGPTSVPMAPREIDMRWLFSDEFFPPGARRIIPAGALTPKSYDTPRASFPSDEICPSPSGVLTLLSDSSPTRRVMVHWLLMHRKGVDLAPSLFHTTNAFEVLWAGDSQHVAITDFVGHNRSEVLMVDATDYSKSDPIDLAPALEAHFSPLQLSSPTFVRAHRWSDGALAVIRGVGRLSIAPFDQFGYEVLVDSGKPGDSSSMIFLRGYIKPNTSQ